MTSDHMRILFLFRKERAYFSVYLTYFGSGATVVYNFIDFQLRNDTTDSYQLRVRVGDKDLVGEWRCEKPSAFKYEVYESQHAITHEWWGGYMRHNVLKRRIFDTDNIQVGDEFITENHAHLLAADIPV